MQKREQVRPLQAAPEFQTDTQTSFCIPLLISCERLMRKHHKNYLPYGIINSEVSLWNWLCPHLHYFPPPPRLCRVLSRRFFTVTVSQPQASCSKFIALHWHTLYKQTLGTPPGILFYLPEDPEGKLDVKFCPVIHEGSPGQTVTLNTTPGAINSTTSQNNGPISP